MRVLLTTLAFLSVFSAFWAPVPVSGEPAPPSILYPSHRESVDWVDTPGGRVPVDKGLEWQGVKVYLSLMSDLVAVDTKTGKTLWAEFVGAFWNQVGFEEVEVEGGRKAWAVALRPGPQTREGGDKILYRDLLTGKEIRTTAQKGKEEEGLGKKLPCDRGSSGEDCRIAKPFHLLVTRQEDYLALWLAMFHDPSKFLDYPAPPGVDFATHIVLAVSSGDTDSNCNGIQLVEVWENEKQVLVRTRANRYQTCWSEDHAAAPEQAKRERPWGIFILPRREKKAYGVEEDVQGLIGGPALWKKRFRYDALPADPAQEMKGLPEADKPSP